MKKITYIISLFVCSGLTLAFAQQQPQAQQPQQTQRQQEEPASFNEKVLIVAPYQPTLIQGAATAPRFTPSMPDSNTVSIVPASEYVIYSSPEKTEYSTENMKPARISGEPLDKIFHQHIKLGFGNYLTPLAEAYFSLGRNKNYGVAGSYKHLSSFGKIKEYSKYKPNFVTHDVDILGHAYQHPDFTATANIYYNYNQVNCYGVYDNADTSFIESFEWADQPQRWYQNFGFRLRFDDNATKPEQWKYTATARYNYNLSAWFSREHSVEILGRLEKKLDFINKHTDELRVGGIFGFDDNTYNAHESDITRNSFIVRIEPTVYYSFWAFELSGGLRLYVFKDEFSNNPKAQFNPVVDFKYHIVKNVLTAFAGLTGNVERNTLEKISNINPYLHPELAAENLQFSQDKLNFYIGLKSNVSKNIDMGVKGEFMMRSNILNFTYHLQSTGLHFRGYNDFVPIYSDNNVFFMRIKGDMNLHWGERISAHIEANYNYFDKALYYTPSFEAKASFRYNIGNKFIITTDMLVYSNMRGLNRVREEENVKGGFDWNLGFEYRFFRRWSAFAQVNNLIAQRYFKWYDYPSYRINFIVGATFSF